MIFAILAVLLIAGVGALMVLSVHQSEEEISTTKTKPTTDPTISQIYQLPYEQLAKELKYARVTWPADHQTITINEANKLVAIVRAFDLLQLVTPTKEWPTSPTVIPFTLNIWCEGTSINYTIIQESDKFYYTEKPGLKLRLLPDTLTHLLQLEK
ncbi:MAG: hypothetical protein ACM3O9_03045 [Methylocystaceae bacterium]